MSNLTPENAFIFRIVHVECVPWILDHGLHCRTSPQHDPHYVSIGNPELIDKRARFPVPIPPAGVLSDYVPFYFTPHSIMLLNIHTGYGGITRRTNRDIVIFVSSLHQVRQLGLSFVFTDQHALAAGAEFFSDLSDLGRVDWATLQSRDFRKSDADPGRPLRYQAEALIHRHVPLPALKGIGCYDETVQKRVQDMVAERGLTLSVKAVPNWYFS